MADEQFTPVKLPERSVSYDLLFKLLPYAILIAGYLVGFGKKSDNLDVVVQQLTEQRATLNNINERISSLSDRVSKIEGSQETMRRDLDQDRVYRDTTHH